MTEADAELTKLRAQVGSLHQEIEKLRLERDAARAQFDRHVEWASEQGDAADQRLAALREKAQAVCALAVGLPDDPLWIVPQNEIQALAAACGLSGVVDSLKE